jgi:hypothetical protein
MANPKIAPSHEDFNEDYTGSVCLLHILTKKFPKYEEVLIDAEDYPRLSEFTWRVVTIGKDRAKRMVRRGDNRYIHSVVMHAARGKPVDHIFHRPLDNRKAKLRHCTTRENNLNTRGSKTGTSKYKGVWWYSNLRKWYVQAGTRQKRVFLGAFVDEIEAARAYNEWAIKHFGPMAYLNPV